MAKITLNLKALRARAGVTQATLAADIGVDQSVVSRIERGRFDPSLHMIARIMRALRHRGDPTQLNELLVYYEDDNGHTSPTD